MPTAMLLQWEGITADGYDRVMELLRLDEEPPEGAFFHVAGAKESGWCVLDLWESKEAWERFQSGRLAQALREAGLEGQPKIDVFPVHNIYAPGADEIARMGASSLASAVRA